MQFDVSHQRLNRLISILQSNELKALAAWKEGNQSDFKVCSESGAVMMMIKHTNTSGAVVLVVLYTTSMLLYV